MILGRNAGLWTALIVAAVNVAVVVFGMALTVDQIAVLNAFGLAVVGVVANVADPTTVGTFTPTIHPPTS